MKSRQSLKAIRFEDELLPDWEHQADFLNPAQPTAGLYNPGSTVFLLL
jgi:hypothetical protein